MAKLQTYKTFVKKLFKQISPLVQKMGKGEKSLNIITEEFKAALKELRIWEAITGNVNNIAKLSQLLDTLKYTTGPDSYIHALQVCAKIVSLWDLPEFKQDHIHKKLELGYIQSVRRNNDALIYTAIVLTGPDTGLVDKLPLFSDKTDQMLISLGIPVKYMESVRTHGIENPLGMFCTREQRSGYKCLVKTEYAARKNFPILQKRLGYDAKIRKIPVTVPRILDKNEVLTWFYLGD